MREYLTAGDIRRPSVARPMMMELLASFSAHVRNYPSAAFIATIPQMIQHT